MQVTKFCFPMILALVPLVCASGEGPLPRPQDPPFRYKLEAQASVTVNQAVELKFTLENVSPEAYYVLTWYTPLEGLKGKIFKVLRGADEIPYIGRMIKRGEPLRKDYVRIAPGESVAATIDLSEGYDMRTPGRYKIEFEGCLRDFVREGEVLPRRSDVHRRLAIPGNAAIIDLRR